jgi:hypothetical protein
MSNLYLVVKIKYDLNYSQFLTRITNSYEQPCEIYDNKSSAFERAYALHIEAMRSFDYRSLPHGIINLMSYSTLALHVPNYDKINWKKYGCLNEVTELSEEQKNLLASGTHITFFDVMTVPFIKNHIDPDKYSRFKNLKV